MPINPNIALGAQTPAPVNFLGQMGQMLALKAAAQDVQGGEALRDFYTKGGDATTPEGVRALMAANPKMGMQILKGQSEMSARDVETQAKSLKSIKENVSLVNSPEGMVEFLRGAYSTPGGALLAKLAPLDKAIAAIPTDAKSFEDYKRNLGLTSDRLFQSADAQLSSRTSLTTAGMAANTAANRLAFDKARQDVIEGSDGFIRKDPYGNLYRVEGYGTMRGPDAAPPAAAPLPPAAANAFVTQQPSVNALAPSAPSQGAGPTVANALAMEAQNNIPKPKVPIRQPVAVIKDGQVTLVPPDQAVGMTPATPGAEKALEKQTIAKEGKESVNRVLSTLYSEYGNLVKSGGITDTRRSVEENIAARTGASAVGQLAGSFTGSESQAFRDTIEQTRPLLLTAIMKATGLSATQLNSNVELQTYLKTATDPKVSIQSNVKALNNISQMFGIGEKFEVPNITTPKEAKAADTPPAGLSPEISGLWKYMSPEDRKLWQK
jgi:hypothetical protein